MLLRPSSFSRLLLRLILLNLYLVESTLPIASAPSAVIPLFSRYKERRVSFSSSAAERALAPTSPI